MSKREHAIPSVVEPVLHGDDSSLNDSQFRNMTLRTSPVQNLGETVCRRLICNTHVCKYRNSGLFKLTTISCRN